MVRFIGPGRDVDAGRGVLDGRTAIGWRGLCECGWRGPLWRKVTDAGQHDLAAHKVYDPALSEWGDPPSGIEDAIWREWHRHLPPKSLADVREAAGDVRKAQARLDEVARRARAEGCSWTAIGGAAGITCPAAQERWGKP